MKGKMLLGLAMMSMVASSAFAMEIYKGKLLNHNETTQGKVKFNLLDAKLDVKKELAAMKAKHLLQQNEEGDFIGAKNEAIEAFGVVNQDTTLEGNSEVHIMNDTSSAQTYTIRTNICSMDMGGSFFCGMSTDVVQLDPAGYVMGARMPSLTVNYWEAGSYANIVTTTVTREGQSSTFMTYDFANVTIYPGNQGQVK
jgi:hypothetical protein